PKRCAASDLGCRLRIAGAKRTHAPGGMDSTPSRTARIRPILPRLTALRVAPVDPRSGICRLLGRKRELPPPSRPRDSRRRPTPGGSVGYAMGPRFSGRAPGRLPRGLGFGAGDVPPPPGGRAETGFEVGPATYLGRPRGTAHPGRVGFAALATFGRAA